MLDFAPSAPTPTAPPAAIVAWRGSRDLLDQHHIEEIVEHLCEDDMQCLLDDIAEFERTGKVSETIGTVIVRAECLSDVERIMAKY